MDWLQKILQGLIGPQSSSPPRTPPFVASGQPPLHSSVPEPGVGPYAQQTVPAAAVPTAMPANQVPTSPPGTATANIPDPARYAGLGNLPQMGHGPTAEEPVAAVPKTRRQQLEEEYEATASSPAKKQNKWLQGLALGLQATQRIADPENRAGSYKTGEPIQWLGDMKKADKLRRIEGELAPIYQQQKRRYEGVLAGIKGEKEIADLDKTRAETERIKRDPTKTITKESEGKVYYSEDGGKSWNDAKGIPAPPRVKVKLANGAEVEMAGKDVYSQEQQNKRNEATNKATLQAKEVDREIAQGKYTVEQGNDYKAKTQKWQADVSKLVTDGEEKQNLAAEKERQAAVLEAQGGVAEAAALRKEAIADRTEGRALIRQGNELRNNPPPKPDTYTVPKSRGKMNKSRDPAGYFQ